MPSDEYQDFLRELKLRTNLVDTISRYVPVQKKGGRFFCVCPFHADKNPSMAINEQDGYYHCFACQATGDAIKFIMDIESIEFGEAIKILAEKANIPVPEFKKDPQAEKKKAHSDVLKQIMVEAAKFYRGNLVDEIKGKEAREYLESRGINDEISKRYGLGVSLDYETLPKYLRYKGFKLSDIKECGLIANVDKPSDMFANRVIVPIIDSMGNVVAFGGRVYHGEDKTMDVAKYKNSTNTPLFNKSYFVYGINFVKRDRKTAGPVQDLILVEGYMDVIALGTAGINNVVAGMGTALTEGQAREIKKIVSTIYVCYDGDSAGRKATFKNIDILDSVGFDVKVMSLENGEDPDEAIKNHGKEYYLKKKEEALSITEYKLKLCELAFDLKTTEGKAKYVQNAVKVLKKFADDEARLEVYAKIVSGLSGVSVDAIKKSAVSGVKVNMDDKAKPKIAPDNDEAKNRRASRFILNRIMTNAPYVNLTEISPLWFNNATHKEIYNYAVNLEKGTDFNVGLMFSTIENNDEITAILDISLKFNPYEKDREYYLGCLNTIANDYIQGRIDALSSQLNKITDSKEKRPLQIEIQDLKRKKHSTDLKDKI
ncbi:MAG: DNA primase [Clostridia bacterium]|nr:DNA primase [Clostridia bacterium]